MSPEPPTTPENPLRILVVSDADRRIVSPEGEVDLYTVGQLESELSRHLAEAPELVLDLSGVSFIDSSGLALLVAVSRAARENGRRLALRDPSPPVVRLITLTGVQELLGSPRP